MELLVLGASGRCGRLLTQIAVDRGHRVTAVVRRGSEDEVPAGAEVLRCEVSSRQELAPVLQSHQVILSALGLNRDGLNPWSRLRSPRDLVESVSRTVRERASRDKDLRFIWISAGGVGASYAHTTGPVRAMIRLGNVGVAYKDLERAERVLEGVPGVSFPVRPVTLLPGDTGTVAQPVPKYGLLSATRRGAVARYMVQVAEEPQRFRVAPPLIG